MICLSLTVSEAVPVQNQAAAQKLLQKMSQPSHKEMHSRFHKQKFRAKQDEAAVFTLDEWERTKGMKVKPMITGHTQDTSHDEELARQLQSQIDLEDFTVSIYSIFSLSWLYFTPNFVNLSGKLCTLRSGTDQEEHV